MKTIHIALFALLGSSLACSQGKTDEKVGSTSVDASAVVRAVRTGFPMMPLDSAEAVRELRLPKIDARIPASARDSLHVSSPDHPDAWLDVRALDLEDVPARHVDGAWVHLAASHDLDVVRAPSRGGLEEVRYLRSAKASSTLRYHVEHSAGYTLRLREGRVELVDGRGYVTIACDPIVAYDAKGVRRDAQVTLTDGEVVAKIDTAGLAFPVAIDPLWTTAPAPFYAHLEGARTFLADGRLFVTAGYDGGSMTLASEIYNPTTNTWALRASIPTGRRYGPMIARIQSGTHAGKILVSGGNDASTAPIYANELFDPATNTWSTRAAVPTTASGKQMVSTGSKVLTLKYGVYDANTDAWTAATWDATSTANGRFDGAGLVTLSDGRVLVIAGQGVGPTTFGKVDMFDPTTNTLKNVADTPVQSMFAGITMLTPTKVLVTGGTVRGIKSSAPTNSAAIYDVTANTWTPTGSMISARANHTATLLPSGRVVIIGGIVNVELYDPVAGTFSAAGNAPVVFQQPGFLLPSGGVVLGGDPVGVYQPYPLGTACTFDNECASGHCTDGVCCGTGTCATGAKCNTPTKKGTCAKPLATTCSAGTECESGSCVDGVCCNTSCTGQCQACDVAGKTGTCSPVSGAVHGTRTACMGASSSDPCAKQICNGTDTAACHYAPAATVPCGANTCMTGTETHTSSCDGAGKCSDVPKSCGVYVCGATSCKFSCTATTDCVTGYYCKSSACVPLEGLGKSCSASVPCGSGLFCTDGVCCGVASCGTGSTCGAPGHEGVCVKSVGATCATEGECASGACVDGYCCDSACSGQCEACDVPGSLGTCVAATGKPHGARPACASDPSDLCSASFCDGSERASCAAYAGSDTTCREKSCKGSTLTASALCDGKGACPAATTSSCGGYTCDETAGDCRTSCTDASHCASGFVCTAGKCEKPAAYCSTDGSSLVEAAGGETSCAPYVCRADACLKTCTSSDDCAAPNICNAGSCAPPPGDTPGATEDSGGGCAFGGRGTAGFGAMILLGALASGLRRRRR